MSKLRNVFLYALALLSLTSARSQVGIQPLGTYNAGVDNISIATLSVHYDIPLFTRKERGAGTDILVHLVYDGGALDDGFGSTIVNPGSHAWRLALDTSASASGHSTAEMDGNPSCPLIENAQDRYFDYTVTDNSGYIHYFPFRAHYDGCTGNFTDLTSPVAATDGSGYLLISTSYGTHYVIGTPSGARISCTQSSDGNDICSTTDSNGNSSQIYLDTYGLHFSDPAGSYLNISGTSSGIYLSSSPVTVSYKDTSGNTQTVTINTQGYPVYSPALLQATGSATVYLPSSIQFPDGTGYAFSYEPSVRYSGKYTGRLASVTLPTGGTISYSYTDGPDRDSDGNFNPYISSLARTTSDGAVTYDNSRNGVWVNDQSGFAWRQTTVSEQLRTTTYNFVGGLAGFLETSRAVYEGNSASGTAIQTMTHCYNGATSNCGGSNVNGVVSQIDTTTTRGSATSRTVEFLNSVSLPTELDEYDFGASTPTKKTLTSYESLSNYISDRVHSVTVKNGSDQIVSQVSYAYDTKGNRTDQHVWLNTTGGTIDTGWQYDGAGQVTGQKDGLGNWTYFDYDPSTDSCLWKRRYAYTVPGASAPLSESSTCNAYTGAQETATDLNGVVTTYHYDSMLRSSGSTSRDSANNLQADQTTTYAVSGGHVVVTSTTKADPNPSITTTRTLDGYGRLYSQTLANNATVDTRYDSLGRVHTVSNPYFSTSDSTYGVTTYGYDSLNRQNSVLESDGVSSTSTTYSGKTVTSTDELQNSYVRDYNIWGNVTQVQEPGGAYTNYTYDLLGNLTSVNQSGRTRSFAYDSASRLLASYNLETGSGRTCSGVPGNSWSMCYLYDSNGNLLQRTDARGITAISQYDVLNRVTLRSYSDGTRAQYYSYDGTAIQGYTLPAPYSINAAGRLSQTSDYTSVGYLFAYDAMGRIQTKQNANSGITYTSALYDLAGNMTSLTYPSGRQITKTYDSAGRLSSITGGPSNPGYAFVSSISYHPDGSPETYVYGNGTSETIRENSRLQTCESRVYNSSTTFNHRQYFYGTSNVSGQQCNAVAGNNGNIWNINDALGGFYSQNFSYDALNRLTAWTAPNMASHYRHLDYSYDSLGNLLQLAPGGPASASQAYDSNNRLLANQFNCYGKNGETGGYDAAGNVLCTGNQNTDAKAFVWDAESRISQVWTQQNNNTYYQAAAYTYDALGQRTRSDTTGGNWREYYTFDGQVLEEREQDTSYSDYIYAGTKRIARADSYDQRIHLHGTQCSGCGWQSAAWVLPLSGYTVQAGDTISWRQYQYGTGIGGLTLNFTDGSNTNWGTSDTSGQVMNNLTTHNQWVNRTVDLSAFAGKTVYDSWIGVEGQTQPGDWDEWFAEIAIVSLKGTVTPIYNRLPTISLSPFGTGGMTNLSANVEHSNSAGDAALVQLNTTYYVGDHLGTTQLHFAAGGWPVWQGEFDPFGQEVDNQPTDNHYKFTGKERDAESGLDYFGARYLSSNMGRFMSPDWSSDPDAVPYASLENPQSLNLYSYAGNNPVNASDADGHMAEWGASGRGACSDGTVAGACPVAKMTDQITVVAKEDGPFQINPVTLMQITMATFNQLAMAAEAVKSYIQRPVDPGCMARQTGTGAAIGTGGAVVVSAFGLATGPGDAAIAPAAFGTFSSGGALAGNLAGLAICRGSGSGGGSGGGGSSTGRSNTIHHLFAKSGHNLEVLLRRFGGNEEAAYSALEQATKEQVTATGQFEQQVSVGGLNVTVRGNVINGMPRIGTAFIKAGTTF
ncbi:RHS repeat-associated core domain-containing protein [Terriglobus sp. TAA 43]|uniref:RHS repeat-associated core domain-containing protein n=1 Tax=Terriglobus sp. TAA 43 TaxID=278961 RepID=UPI000645559F|nr:RHS repeat-associated core domain-containing protein [Terriglobus sp. TAA 43]